MLAIKQKIQIRQWYFKKKKQNTSQNYKESYGGSNSYIILLVATGKLRISSHLHMSWLEILYHLPCKIFPFIFSRNKYTQERENKVLTQKYITSSATQQTTQERGDSVLTQRHKNKNKNLL